MNHITLILLATLCVTIQSSSAASFNYKNAFSFFNSYDFTNECTKPGPMCRNCAELVNCVKVGDEFDPIPIETCNQPDETCLIDECTTDSNPQCGGTSDFTCHNTGVFPDPFNCHTYHICVEKQHNLETGDVPDTTTQDPEQEYSYQLREIQDTGNVHIPVKCDDGYGYNPITTYCSKSLTNNVCPETPPVPECTKSGQSGAITGTSIYYMCTRQAGKFTPQLFMCPHGTKYVKGACV